MGSEEKEWLAEQFESNRAHLRSVAFRMLGSLSEAEDAVQEAWIRLSRSDTSEVKNLGGWLTTVVARVCLDLLRSRESRREESLSADDHEGYIALSGEADPEHEVVMADSVGLAMLVVLETLSPAERLAFVLHDMFAVPFDEIAPLVGRSPTAARQLASRARRRVQGKDAVPGEDADRQREIVSAFLAASREGDFEALVAILAPGVMLRTDRAAAQIGAEEAQGADAVAKVFVGRARGARIALIDGAAGAIWAQGGRTRVIFEFEIANQTITAIYISADAERIDEANIEIL